MWWVLFHLLACNVTCNYKAVVRKCKFSLNKIKFSLNMKFWVCSVLRLFNYIYLVCTYAGFNQVHN
jgi:hypothetical protein